MIETLLAASRAGRPCSISSGQVGELFEVAAEQAVHIALYILPRHRTPITGQQSVAVTQHLRHGGARVPPFVEDLLEHPRIGMLRNETRPQQLNALPRNLFHNGRIVQEPPASEGHEVTELAGVHAEFVLVFAAQNTAQNAVVRVVAADIFQ